MSISVRPAKIADLDTVVDLFIADAEQRQARDPVLWKVDPAASDRVRSAIKAFMEKEEQRLHQELLLAEADGTAIGLAHTLVLPVPPIYAGGTFGPPGLILENCHVRDDAPAGAYQVLIEAAEADLLEAGAETLLGQSAAGRVLEEEYKKRGYEPLTLYFAKEGLRQAEDLPTVRGAKDSDVEDIVTASAQNRRILNGVNTFWKPSDDADSHFATWMRKSLTLDDRDMFVSAASGKFNGYAISQPASYLHFPMSHDIGAIGFIDDYFHTDLADTAVLPADANGASDLLHAAEAALEARGNDAVLMVCPAAWPSKIKLLEAAGYATAITWFKKS